MRSQSARTMLLFCSVPLIGLATPRPVAAAQSYLVTSNTGAIREYDLSGQYLRDVIGPNAALGAPQHLVLHNGNVITCGYFNSRISTVNLQTGAVTSQWTVPGGAQPAFMRLSPDDSELWVSFLNSNRVLRLNPDSGDVLGDLFRPGLIAAPHGIDVLPDGSYLVTSGDDSIYRVTSANSATAVASIPTGDGRPTNTELLDDGDTVVVTTFTNNTSRTLQSFSLSTGQVHGAFSEHAGRQADGLIRGHDDHLYAVYYGSNSIGRYDTDGTFEEWFVPTGSGLVQPNAILLIPAPSTAVLALAPGLVFFRRARSSD